MRTFTPVASILLPLVLSLLLPPAVVADQVYLTNGKVMEGKARRLADGRVEVEMTIGTVTLPGDKVERIERGETLEELVRETLRTLPARDVESRFDLALWCREQGAHTLSRQLLEEVLTLDPNHTGAREALGFRQYEGRWVTEQEYRELRGEVQYQGRWLPVETVHRLLTQEAARAADQRLAAARQAQLDAELARLALAREAAQQRSEAGSYGLPFYPSYGSYYGVPVVPVVTPHAGTTPPHTGDRRPGTRPPHRTQPPPTQRHQPRNYTTTLKKE